jgi:hypothetical protein
MARTAATIFIPLRNNLTAHYDIYNHKPIISNDYIQRSEPPSRIAYQAITSVDNEDPYQEPTIDKLASPFSPARRERRTDSPRPVDSHLSRGLLILKTLKCNKIVLR